MPDESLRASVVIPVRDGAAVIGIQLAALAAQSVSDFEVIVSDNGSTDGTRAAALAWQDRLPHLRIVDSSQRAGVAQARNVGARVAATDKIMFCDADDVACPVWVESIATGLDTADIVGGVLDTRDLNPRSIHGLVGEFNVAELPTTLRYLPYAYGGDMGVRKVVFENLDGFDVTYRGGHEEVDFCWRAQEAGYSVALAPDAVLHYRLKDDLRGMVRQRYWFGRSNAQLQARFRRPGMPPFTIRRQVRILGSTLLELPRAVTHRETGAWLVGAAWAVGRISGRLVYGRSPDAAADGRRPRPSPAERVRHAARQAKHAAFVARKNSLRATRPAWQPVLDAGLRLSTTVAPLRFDALRYPDHPFLAAPAAEAPPQPVPRVLYSLWTGTNAMSANRLAGLETLRTVTGVPVTLVTPDNLDSVLVPGVPLHPAYDHLSLVHKSDYLRCYLMHHHGGGYADIKRYSHSWVSGFELLEADAHALAVGCRERRSSDVALVGGQLEADLRRHHRRLIGNGSFIVRPRSPFTTLWWEELNRRLDEAAILLAANPGDERGTNPGYPLEWTGILGDIIHPLELRFADRLRHDDRLRPSYRNYQ